MSKSFHHTRLAWSDANALLMSRARSAGVVFGFTFLIGGLGYSAIGQGEWSLAECFYMTIVTLSTVGFSETLPGMATRPLARAWTVVLILLGSGTLLYFASTLTAFLVEGDLRGALRRQRMTRLLDTVHDHIIVCGAGATGSHVVSELLATHTPFVVVDRDLERLEHLADEGGPTFLYVQGEAADDQTLEEAGIRRASGLVAALTEDRDNVFVCVTARALNENLRIVAKGVSQENVQKLRRAGADEVVSPAFIGGLRLASVMLRPAVVSFLDTMIRDRNVPRRIEEIRIPETSHLVGRTLTSSNFRQESDALVIAVRTPAGVNHYNPGADTVLEAGATLIVMVRTDHLHQLRRLVHEAAS
ncbi:MAG: voltage-gated potassium channel [Myxococcota bacterium]